MLVTVVFWAAAAPAGVASENDDVEVKGRLSLGGAGQAVSVDALMENLQLHQKTRESIQMHQLT
jgi:hypothetical protein